LAIATAAIVGPFLLVLLAPPTSSRPFVFELGSGLGIGALSLLALQLVLPSRLHLLARLGADVAVRLHRHLADVLITVIAAHVAVVMVADPKRLALLAFFGAPWRAQAAVASVVAIIVLATTSILRRRLRLPYAVWRGVHVLLAGAALLFAVVHTVGVGRYLASGPALIALGGLTVAGIGATLALRVPRFRRHTVRPYVVERVIREQGGATTLVLAADGHAGQRFAPGQFAWLKQPGVRSSLAEHPFSYSSSAVQPDRPSFTIQPYGGFSREVAAFKPGMRLIVDGPHGAFRLRSSSSGAILVAGGIGITPSVSILRTAAERRDPRPFLLVYGVKRPDRVVFASELDRLRSRVNLTVVRVMSDPPEDWPGERGRITPELFDRWLPADLRGWQFLVCGPPAFVDASVAALMQVGIPADRVHAERFVGV
jgi:predicted ferric reductase